MTTFSTCGWLAACRMRFENRLDPNLPNQEITRHTLPTKPILLSAYSVLNPIPFASSTSDSLLCTLPTVDHYRTLQIGLQLVSGDKMQALANPHPPFRHARKKQCLADNLRGSRSLALPIRTLPRSTVSTQQLQNRSLRYWHWSC